MFFVLASAAGTRDLYEFVTKPVGRRLGIQGWLGVAIILSELMLAIKYWHALPKNDPMPFFVQVGKYQMCRAPKSVFLEASPTELFYGPYSSGCLDYLFHNSHRDWIVAVLTASEAKYKLHGSFAEIS